MSLHIPLAARALKVRALRALALGLACVAGLTCRDRSPTGPGVPTRAALAVTPQLVPGPAGGPAIGLVRVRAWTHLYRSGPDTLQQVLNYSGGTLVLAFTVPVTGVSQLYQVHLAGIDANGDTLLRGLDTVRVYPDVPILPHSIALAYSGADASVTDIAVAPGDTVLDASDSLRLRASIEAFTGGTAPPTLLLGWTSRDTDAAPVSASGTVRPRNIQRDVWIVARTATGVADSALVRVRARVSAVVMGQDTASVARGDSVRLTAEARDSIGTALTGRGITWTSDNANVSVDSTGLVRGLVARTSALVIATSGGRSDTTIVTVLARPVASVVASPDTVALVVGGTLLAAAQVLDAQGASNPDWTVVWSTSDSARAAVSTSGLITARAAGQVTIRATADARQDSVMVSVVLPVSSSTVSPRLDTLTSLQDTVVLSAQAYQGTTPVAGSFTWTSRDPGVATVTGAGEVVAVGNGSAWVVATERGGTRDSALIVVNQRVSTVSVLPAGLTRYLGSRQQFTARALDGRGNPVAFATVRWTSTAPGIVSVDTVSGLAQTLALGTATIQATAGGITGQAALAVITAITRIAVTPDSVTLTSLGATQDYAATAYDTLNVAMSEIAFDWLSTNPGVASLGRSTATTTVATSSANGLTRIRASAQGVSGDALLTVQQQQTSGVLAFANGPGVLGAGQYEPNMNYLFTTAPLSQPLTVTVTSSDTAVAGLLQTTFTIPAGQNTFFVGARGLQPGTSTITATAPGWTTATTSVRVTVPRLDVNDGGITRPVTDRSVPLTVYVADTNFAAHFRSTPLVVSLASTDTTIVQVDSAVTISADSSRMSLTARLVAPGVAYVKVTAPGHLPDSTRLTITGLPLGASDVTLGVGQYSKGTVDVPYYAYRDGPITVTLTPSDTTRARFPRTVVIPGYQSYVQFDIFGDLPGTVSYRATAPGWEAATGTIIVTTPRVMAGNSGGTFLMYSAPRNITVSATDSLGAPRLRETPLVVTLRSEDTSVFRIDSSTVTIGSGFASNGLAKLSIAGAGSARLYLTAPGHLGDSSQIVTVDSASLAVGYALGFSTDFVIGTKQTQQTSNYVTIPGARAAPVVVTVTQKHPEYATLPATIAIAADSTYQFVGWTGVAPGRDTITFTAMGYRSTTIYLSVSRRLLNGLGIPTNLTTTAAPFWVSANTTDTTGTVRAVSELTTIRLRSSDTTVLRVDSTYVHILAGSVSSNGSPVRVVGPGSARIIYEDSTGVMPPDSSNAVTVTTPAVRVGTARGVPEGGGQGRPGTWHLRPAPRVAPGSQGGTARVTSSARARHSIGSPGPAVPDPRPRSLSCVSAAPTALV